MTSASTLHSQFWRNPALPWIELRYVREGQGLAHAAHSHDTFSIGTLLQGQCRYQNGKQTYVARAGDTVVVNPEAVHACNPQGEEGWSYVMLFIDQQQFGHYQGDQTTSLMQPYAQALSHSVQVAQQVTGLARAVMSEAPDALAYEEHLHGLVQALADEAGYDQPPIDDRRITHALALMRHEFAQPLSLAMIAREASLSVSQLVRGLRQQKNCSPHAYLTSVRLQHARRLLQQGASIAEAAQHTGFADQAHLQRQFKRCFASTPGHYQKGSQ